MADIKRDYFLTKTDFKTFLECPMHLWAKVHGQMDLTLSPMAQGLIRQGYEVEQLAQTYLWNFVVCRQGGERIISQGTFIDGQFSTRVDALIYLSQANSCDLYEIKSSTSVDKEDYWDGAFQYVILKEHLNMRHIYLLHLNHEYTLGETLDLPGLFLAEDVTEEVQRYAENALDLREQALRVAAAQEPKGVEHCYSPKDCPCPKLCHPNLPEFSIYDIPGLRTPKKQSLEVMGILEAARIPQDFPLNEKQFQFVKMVKKRACVVDQEGIGRELEKLLFPLYFLDYETYMPAIPLFPGYHPHQSLVFQYSLHQLDAPDGRLTHTEHVCTTKCEPSLGLLEKLSHEIGGSGTVLVWNKVFEKGRNAEMMKIHPEYGRFLEDLNDRIYDLGDFFSKGYYQHPDFKGSWSIKRVLPVMVPSLSYDALDIHEGGQASEDWWRMVYGGTAAPEKENITSCLLKYCEMDSLAMVEIYRRLVEISQ
ncbi:MAG: DUF2779 domain-containing protein, partial [Anaerolineaceae bacterium]